jgi:hypothetical protein
MYDDALDRSTIRDCSPLPSRRQHASGYGGARFARPHIPIGVLDLHHVAVDRVVAIERRARPVAVRLRIGDEDDEASPCFSSKSVLLMSGAGDRRRSTTWNHGGTSPAALPFSAHAWKSPRPSLRYARKMSPGDRLRDKPGDDRDDAVANGLGRRLDAERRRRRRPAAASATRARAAEPAAEPAHAPFLVVTVRAVPTIVPCETRRRAVLALERVRLRIGSRRWSRCRRPRPG